MNLTQIIEETGKRIRLGKRHAEKQRLIVHLTVTRTGGAYGYIRPFVGAGLSGTLTPPAYP